MKTVFKKMLHRFSSVLVGLRFLFLRQYLTQPVLTALESKFASLNALQASVELAVQNLGLRQVEVLSSLRDEQVAATFLVWNKVREIEQAQTLNTLNQRRAEEKTQEKICLIQSELETHFFDQHAKIALTNTLQQTLLERIESEAVATQKLSKAVSNYHNELTNMFNAESSKRRDEQASQFGMQRTSIENLISANNASIKAQKESNLRTIAHADEAIKKQQLSHHQALAQMQRTHSELAAEQRMAVERLRLSIIEIQDNTKLHWQEYVASIETHDARATAAFTALQTLLHNEKAEISAQFESKVAKLQSAAVLAHQAAHKQMHEQAIDTADTRERLKNLSEETQLIISRQSSFLDQFENLSINMQRAIDNIQTSINLQIHKQAGVGLKLVDQLKTLEAETKAVADAQRSLDTMLQREVSVLQASVKSTAENLETTVKLQSEQIVSNTGESGRLQSLVEGTQALVRLGNDAISASLQSEANGLTTLFNASHAELQSRLQQQTQENTGLSKRQQLLESALSEGLAGIIEKMVALNFLNVESKQQVKALHSAVGSILEYSYASARRVVVPCGPNAVLLKTAVGYLLCSPSDHALLACLVDTGEMERGTRLLIEKILKPGDVFIDVGANIGMHTLAAARAMQGRGKIVAYEPFEPTCKLLGNSIWLNGFSNLVEIHHAAASNKTGSSKLYLGLTSGHHSLFELDKLASASELPIEVRLEKLDALVPTIPFVNLIKIDAEGAEIDVLKGGHLLISSNPEVALIVEFGPLHLRRTKYTIKKWLGHFESLGFIFRAVHELTGELEVIAVKDLEKTVSVNLLFARPEATVWSSLKVAVR